jgi:hypothetical protein
LFEDKKATLINEKREWEEQLEKLRNGPTRMEQMAQYFELSNTAYSLYKSGTAEEKREILNSVVSNFLGIGNELAITLRFPFQEIIKLRNSDLSAVDCGQVRTFAQNAYEALRKAASEGPQQRHSSPLSPDGRGIHGLDAAA